MPKYERYPNETAQEARKRIAKNRARGAQEESESLYDKVKTKADMMAENISKSLKNLGGGY